MRSVASAAGLHYQAECLARAAGLYGHSSMRDSSGRSEEAAGIGAGVAAEVAGVAGAAELVTGVGSGGTTVVGAMAWPNAADPVGGTVLRRTWPADESGEVVFRFRARRVSSLAEGATEPAASPMARRSEPEALLVGGPLQDSARVAACGAC